MLWQPTHGLLQPNQSWRRPQTPAAGGGNPSTIFGANLSVWYKADIGLTLSGANVTAVADQSGNGRNADNFFNGTPVYSATSFNSGPGITFSTSGSTELASSTFNVSSAVATFWITARFTNLGSNVRVLSYMDNSGNDFGTTFNILALYSPNSSSLGMLHNSVGANWTAAATATYYRLIVVLNGANETLYVNGVQQAQAASTATLGSSTNKLIVGYNAAGSSPDMVISEWGMAKQDGTADVATLDSYLQTKWGL